MSKINRALLLVSIVALVLGLWLPAIAAGENGVIGVMPKSTLYDYWKYVRLGAENAAGEFGYTVDWQGTATDTDVEGQVRIIEDWITKGVKAIVMSPVNPDALVPVLERAHVNGIPVIIIDGRLNADFPYATISTDDYLAGRKAAMEMAQLIGSAKGKIAVVCEVPGSVQGGDRSAGFIDGIREVQGLDLMNTMYSEGDRNRAFNIVQDILTSNHDIRGIFSTNEGASVGVLLAIDASRVDDVVVIGFDTSSEQIEGIRDGIISGTIAQNPMNIGYTGVLSAVKVLNGEQVDKHVAVETIFISTENVDSDEVQALFRLPEGM